MAQKRKKSSKKWIFWVLMVGLFVVAAAVCYLVWNSYFRDKNEDKPVEVEQSLVEESEKNEDSLEETVEVVEKKKVIQYEGEDPNEKEELTGVITYAGVNGDNLMIRVNIDQYLDSGVCELSLVQGGVVYSDTANIVGSATTATCEGFNVPVSRLGGGNYGIVIKISSGDKAGTINGEAKI